MENKGKSSVETFFMHKMVPHLCHRRLFRDIATYRLNWPKGCFSEKGKKYNTKKYYIT